MKLRKRTVIFGACLVAGAAYGIRAIWNSASTGPAPSGHKVTETKLIEASGLAASQRTADLLWSLNDSRNEQVLYGIGIDGRPVARLRVEGASNHDWEALACFRLDGRAWLAIGDIGDNGAGRKRCVVYLVEEPPASDLSAEKETLAPVVWSVPFRYEDGPRDCEAMCVDVAGRQLLLFSKRNRPSHVYAVPLQPTGGAPSAGNTAVAKRLGDVPFIPQPSSLQRLMPSPTGRYRGQPTDAAISPDGTQVTVLTYGVALLFRRESGETWAQVFGREPKKLHPHRLSQAEAICFSADGRELFVLGEQKQPVLVRYQLP